MREYVDNFKTHCMDLNCNSPNIHKVGKIKTFRGKFPDDYIDEPLWECKDCKTQWK